MAGHVVVYKKWCEFVRMICASEVFQLEVSEEVTARLQAAPAPHSYTHVLDIDVHV